MPHHPIHTDQVWQASFLYCDENCLELPIENLTVLTPARFKQQLQMTLSENPQSGVVYNFSGICMSVCL